ncbi:MAG: alpha/beta hydrolase fold domain-containing protein [Acidobacteria bacterium]|nr:alpha/beta hydrolase fold domain-containing protein [Acidobacteriota bacterium]
MKSAGLLLLALAASSFAGSHRFDFGPPESQLADGYTPVSPGTAYSKARGHGFLIAPLEAGVIDKNVTAVDGRFKETWRVENGIAGLNAITRDYVAGPAFRFRADLPKGKYDVVAILGYKHGIHHLEVSANGAAVARDLSVFTYHYAQRGGLEDVAIGANYRLRFVAEVTDGSLVLDFSGDKTKGAVEHVIQGRGQEIRYTSGAPYSVNSLMGLTIAPHRDWPAVALQPGRLFAGEEQAGRIADPLSRAWAYMTLAGHPEIDRHDEARLIRRARTILRAAVKQNPGEVTAADLIEQTEQFIAAVQYFHERDAGNTELATIGGFHKAHSIWRQFGPDHPFHWKGLIYSGRMYAGVFPFAPIPISERGREMLRQVEAKFPGNKYARLFLRQEWSPKEWNLNEYPAPAGTPKWAEVLRRAFCQNLDFAEWWADFRQRPDGSFGGGWNDDVEVMPVWVMNWFISPEASPKVARMLEKFTEGEWQSGNLDRRRAFSAHFSDAEHAAEDQGDSLPYLIGVLYGNPRYLNWNLRTLGHFRDFLTGVNAAGHRHFRSTDFDSTRYGQNLERADREVEAAICYRAFATAPWMLWYNGNPAARKLLLEHAETWRAAAMSTQKGKPRGIMPSQLGFDDVVGGPEKSWMGKPGLGAGGNWPDYVYYLHSLLLSSYAASGDRKYLEPLEETFAFLDRHRPGPRYDKLPDASAGSEAWVYNKILFDHQFADAFWMARELTGDRRYDEFLQQAGRPYVRYRLTLDKNLLVEDIEKTMNQQIRQRWPFMTSEGVLTDRIGYNPRTVSYMTGALPEIGYQGFPHHAVTYTGTGRDFAAVVEADGPKQLRVLYYSFADRPRRIGLRTWKLETGARYRIVASAVDERDQAVGPPIETREQELGERGEPLYVVMPPKRAIRVDVSRVREASEGPAPRADLALTSRDIRWNIHTDQIEATIHNIGSADAHDVDVVFYRQTGKGLEPLERAVITRIGAPNDLAAGNVTVGTWNHRGVMGEGDSVVVVVDPENKLREITKSNNRAVQRLALTEPEREALETRRLTEHDRRDRAVKSTNRTLRTLTNVVYGDDDPEMQRLDAYLVPGEKPAPAVIEFHGGGWRTGEKSDLDQYGGFPRALLGQGYSLISADYRLTPKAIWPAQGEDALRVLDFVRGKAREWNIDPARIALLGGSAGAHLALWAGFRKDVRAIVDLWGPSDLSMISPRVPRGEALTALFDSTADDYERPGDALKRAIREASPLHLVSPRVPPVFIVHDGPADAKSPADPRISGANMGVHSAAFGLALAERLKQAGVEHQVHIAPDAGRTFQEKALEFLRRYL